MNSGFALDTGDLARLRYARLQCTWNPKFWRQSAYHRPSFSNSPRVPGLYNLPAFLLIALALPAFGAAKKVIIDTDPGTDDAMALMLALNSPELDVRAVTVVPGNVTAKQGLENALRMISLANRCDIPVAAGAQHPLFQKLITAEFWHGRMGWRISNCRPANAESIPAGSRPHH